jgi:hypothetical protein
VKRKSRRVHFLVRDAGIHIWRLKYVSICICSIDVAAAAESQQIKKHNVFVGELKFS